MSPGEGREYSPLSAARQKALRTMLQIPATCRPRSGSNSLVSESLARIFLLSYLASFSLQSETGTIFVT